MEDLPDKGWTYFNDNSALPLWSEKSYQRRFGGSQEEEPFLRILEVWLQGMQDCALGKIQRSPSENMSEISI